MKNRLMDLNDHLFMQLERLNEENMTDEQLDREVRRATAMAGVADGIVKSAMIQMRAAELASEYGSDPTPYLPLIEKRS